jgi:hypothetical protein
MAVEDKAFALLEDAKLGPGIVGDIVAPFVYVCWQLRNEAKHACTRSAEREADGSDAMV